MLSLPRPSRRGRHLQTSPARRGACPRFAAALNPPATIRVYRASLGVVQVVDFKFYCKHVLPSEWLREWPVESLRAGAMAVEEYAWYYVSTGGKWPSLGADVRDDYADQKYDPAVSDPRTDAAVDYIWGSYVLRSGGLFVIQYCGDSSLDAVYRCPIHPSRMPQWGTFYLARDKGWNWQQIIHYYWDPVSIITDPATSYTRYEQGNTNIAKTGTWKDYLTTGPSGGSYGRSSTPGAKATIYFTGTRIDWIGMKGITPGIVEVYLDDVLKATLDLYAPSAKYQVMLWSSGTLTNGTHHMDLVRAKASLSTEYLVLDAVDIYGGNIIAAPSAYTRYEQGNTNIAKTGTWKDYLTTGPSGGSYGRSSTPGAKATIYFTGTRIDWIGMKGITPGIVEVYLDDVLKATLDLYAPSAKYQVMLWSSGTLTNGTHHMDLVRAKASLSTEYLVLDAVDIYGGNIIAGP